MLDGRKRKNALWRKQLDGGMDGWPSVALQKFREVEGSLWHVRVELIGWKERLCSLLKKVDGGLGLLMGLGPTLVDNEEVKAMMESRSGLKSFNVNKANGLAKGLVNRPGQWRVKPFREKRFPKARLEWRLSQRARWLRLVL